MFAILLREPRILGHTVQLTESPASSVQGVVDPGLGDGFRIDLQVSQDTARDKEAALAQQRPRCPVLFSQNLLRFPCLPVLGSLPLKRVDPNR